MSSWYFCCRKLTIPYNQLFKLFNVCILDEVNSISRFNRVLLLSLHWKHYDVVLARKSFCLSAFCHIIRVAQWLTQVSFAFRLLRRCGTLHCPSDLWKMLFHLRETNPNWKKIVLGFFKRFLDQTQNLINRIIRC